MAAWRVRFVAQAPDGARVIRRFEDPSPTVAIAEPIDPGDLPPDPAWPEPLDDLWVAHVPSRKTSPRPSIDAGWLRAPDHPGAPRPAIVPLDAGRVLWRPGRALIEGNVGSADDLMIAIAEFAYHESQLRRLERALRPFEAAAVADVPSAVHIRIADNDRWPHLIRSAEALAVLRLAAARLEPRAYCPPRDVPPESRRLVARLAARADVEDRLEAMSARLEACEDLYEGAVDRIADHGWARKGNRLEIGIVVLLMVEVVLLLLELAVRLHQGRAG